MFDSMTSRARRKLEDERLARLLSEARSGETLDADDPEQDHLVDLVDRWKNAQIVGRTSEAEEARTELLQLLEKAETIYRAPDRALQGELIWSGLDNYLGGKTPHYSGDYIIKQKIDKRGRYIEEAEIPDVGARMRVLLSAVDTAELLRLQKKLQMAELGEKTARAAGKPAGEATEKRKQAETAIDEFCMEHGVGLPSRGSNNEGVSEGGETDGA
jgi:hypothetical protein